MQSNEKRTQGLTIRIPLPVLQWIKEMAKRHNRSLNGEILTAIEEYQKKEQREQPTHGETEESL